MVEAGAELASGRMQDLVVVFDMHPVAHGNGMGSGFGIQYIICCFDPDLDSKLDSGLKLKIQDKHRHRQGRSRLGWTLSTYQV
jgi:hypothetical protein